MWFRWLEITFDSLDKEYLVNFIFLGEISPWMTVFPSAFGTQIFFYVTGTCNYRNIETKNIIIVLLVFQAE
jgi:hypothetical protein